MSPLQDVENGRDDDGEGSEGVESEKTLIEGFPETEQGDSRILSKRGKKTRTPLHSHSNIAM